MLFLGVGLFGLLRLVSVCLFVCLPFVFVYYVGFIWLLRGLCFCLSRFCLARALWLLIFVFGWVVSGVVTLIVCILVVCWFCCLVNVG